MTPVTVEICAQTENFKNMTTPACTRTLQGEKVGDSVQESSSRGISSSCSTLEKFSPLSPK